MTTKSYTDLSQSKKLAEILPLESADMHYATWTILDGEFIVSPNQVSTIKSMQEDYGNQIIPCWSLTALLSVLPEYHLSSPNPLEKQCCCRVKDIETYSNNPIDTCVEMILNLLKLKLL